MKKILIICIAFLAMSLIAGEDVNKDNVGRLIIKWQRLVCAKGETCDRCGTTFEEVHKAHQLLKDALGVLGLQVVLDEKAIDEKTFVKQPLESNRIWIGDRALEEWLGAKVSQSSCVTCSDVAIKEVKCRTIKYGGKTYETIPAVLIIKAGLIAAAQIIKIDVNKPCCGEEPPDHKPCESCPQK